jgi:hypothetical protein
MPLLNIFEERFSSSEDNRIDYQSQLIDETEIHQAAHQGGAADDVDIPSGLLFQLSDLIHIAGDPRRLPCDLIDPFPIESCWSPASGIWTGPAVLSSHA